MLEQVEVIEQPASFSSSSSSSDPWNEKINNIFVTNNSADRLLIIIKTTKAGFFQ